MKRQPSISPASGAAKRPRLLVEELEPRILYSADGAALLGAAGLGEAAQVRLFEHPGAGSAPAAPAAAQQTLRQEIIFIDNRVPDALQLADALMRGRTDGRIYDIAILDPNADGITQINRALAGERELAAIHIISHGGAGVLEIGSTRLDAQRLAADADAVAGWGAALAADGDLLLYGCDVAQGDIGERFVQQLAQLTGADVAASSNVTGHQQLGGDWQLEVATGAIDTRSLLDAAAQQAWHATLAITVNSGSSAATIAAGATSLTWSHTTAAGSDRMLTVGLSLIAGESTGVTYGGTPLTLVGRYTDTAFFHTVEIWRLLAPSVGTANIVANFNGTHAVVAGATVYNGVDQTSPTGTMVGAFADSTAPSVTVASAPGDLVMDVLFVDISTAATAGPGQTGRWALSNGRTGAGSTEAGAASVTMSWTLAVADEWTLAGVSIRPSTNTAPVLDSSRSPALAAVSEDAPAPVGAVGTLVSALVDFAVPAGEVDNVTDADSGAQLGIAVVAANAANGSWWYSTNNGTSWLALGTPSDGAARLLATDARLYFRPNADYHGSIADAITFRAWDRTSGSNGAEVSTASNGGSTAFSAATDTASLLVSAINDAPVNHMPVNAFTALDTTLLFSSGNGNALQISDVDAAAGAVRVTLDVTQGTLTLADTTGLTLAAGANGSASVSYTGTVAAINAAFANGIGYAPTTGYRGLARLTLTTDDQGNTGSGGALSDTDSRDIHVGAIVVTNASDASNGTVTSIASLIANDGGDGISLREAMLAANNTAGTDHILFAIAGTGVHTINVSTALPVPTGAVVIDASTDDSFAANGNRPAIVLDGNNSFAGDGLTLAAGASGSTVRGLVIRDFSGHGITIQAGSSGNTIAGNYIGRLTAAGTDAGAGESNTGNGLNILGSGNLIDGNVVSGNWAGIFITGAGASGNSVLRNLVGTDAAGTSAIGNSSNGIDVGSGAPNNTIGSAGAGNVVAASGNDGITIWGAGATGNRVQGNSIGTNAAGTTNWGNSNHGVITSGGAVGTMVGGTGAGEGNLIMHNGGDGVAVADASTQGTSILGNRIAGNAGLGIDLLGVNGVNGNDAGDTDGGANGLQNFPVLASASTNGAQIAINGSLNSAASRSYRIEFFSSSAADASGHGEAETWLGFQNVMTDAGGNASFAVDFVASVPAGAFVTATATDNTSNSSSEFAASISAVTSNTPPVITSNGGGDSAAVSVAENTTAVTTVTAVDADLPAQSLTYSISGGSDAARFTIDPSTGVLRFVSAPDFEAPADANVDNVYEVTVRVSDGNVTMKVNDSFTAASNIALTARLPDTGGAWTEVFDSSVAGTDATINAASDSLHGGSDQNNAGQAYTAGPAPTQANQAVGFTLSAIDTTNGTKPVGVFAHRQDNSNFYFLQILPNTHASDSLQLAKMVGGVRTLLGSVDPTINAGDTFRLELQSGVLKVFRNGVEAISAADASLPLAGTWGVYFGDFNGSINGTPNNGHLRPTWGIDNFFAQELVGVDTQQLLVSVSNVNEAPVATIAPASYAATEQVSLNLKGTGISVSDPDAGAGSLTVTLSVTEGQLHATAGGSGAVVAGSGSASLTITGSAAQINSLFGADASSTVTYLNPSDAPSASATLTLLVNDNGHAGSGGALSHSDTAVIAITAVNDAPLLADANVVLGGMVEDAGAPAGAVGTLVSALVHSGGALNNASDPDGAVSFGIAVIGADNANGSWHYSLDNGLSWNPLGAVDASNARLLAADARLYFQPNANYNGTLPSAITFRAWDRSSGSNGGTASTMANGGSSAFSSATDTASLVVTAVNDAPVLDNTGTMALPNVVQDTASPSGISVAALIASAGGDRITDVDAGAVEGIAITAASSAIGSWQFSTDGGAVWQAVGAVSPTQARLLGASASDWVRFVPNAGASGNASFSFRAWDRSDGRASGSANVDASSHGGTTPFSSAVQVGRIYVEPLQVILWLSTTKDVSNSGVPGMPNWSDGAILAMGDPGLALGPGSTGGRLTQIVDFDNFGSDVNIVGLHRVGTATTLTGAGISGGSVSLQAGDVLFVTASNENLATGAASPPPGWSSTLNASAGSLYAFRPISEGNYTSGWFRAVAGELGADKTFEIVLVEAPVSVGGTLLAAGDILFTQNGGSREHSIYWYRTAANNNVQLIDGAQVGNPNAVIDSLDLVLGAFTHAGVSFEAGDLLIGFDRQVNGVGGGASTLTAMSQDIVRMRFTSTTFGAGTAVASAAMVFDGDSNARFDTNDENVDAFSLLVRGAGGNQPPVLTLPGPVPTFTEGGTAVLIDASATVVDGDSVNLDTGVLYVALSGGASNDDRLTVRHEGHGAGQIGVAGSVVSHGGVVIGSLEGGSDGATPLVVSLNANATPAAAQALLRNLSFSNVSVTPSTAPRTLRILLSDGDGASSSVATKTINVIGLNDVPVAADDGYVVNEDGTLVVGPATAGLSNWWGFDAGGTNQSLVGGGMLANGATRGSGSGVEASDPAWAGGYVGGAGLSFDGAGQYVQTSSTEMASLGAFTVSAWFQTDTTTTTQHLLWQGYAGGDGFGSPGSSSPATSEMGLTIGGYAPVHDNRIVFSLGYDVPANGADSILIVSASTFTDTSAWHHVAVSVADIGGGTMRASLYVDGRLEGTATGRQIDRSAWQALRIGAAGDASRSFDGQIDEVRIYDAELSGAQVVAVMQPGVLRNDSDTDSTPLRVHPTLVSGPSNGTLTVNADGSFTYTPNADFHGTDSFSYRATDGLANTSPATVTITVNPVADAPSVSNSTTSEDTQSSGGLVISRSAFDGAEVTHFKITGITNGTLFKNDGTTVIADGSFISFAEGNAGLRFTPAANVFGSGSFTVQASTSNADAGLGGGTATATVTIQPVADTPSVSAATTGEDSQTTGGLVISRNAADGAEVSHFKITGISNGSLFHADGVTAIADGSFITVAQGSAGLRFTPAANFHGSTSFSVQASTSNGDGGLGGATATAAITVVPVADAPSVTDATTNEDTQSTSGLVISRNIADGAEVTYYKITSIANGTLYLNDGVTAVADGSFITAAQGSAGLRFTPLAEFSGTGSFFVQASTSNADAGLGGASVQATITIVPVNDAPTNSPVTLAPIAEDSGSRIITQAELLANANDVDGPSLTAVNLVISAGLGSLVDNGDQTWTYTPTLNDDSSVSFSYTVTDGSLTVAGSATLDITPVNDSPTTSPVTLAPIAEDSGPRIITQAELLANANDVDGPSLTAVGLTISAGTGTLANNGDGTWTYTPVLNDDSSVSFSYTVTDGSASVAGSAFLDITPVNDAPTNSPVTLAPIAEDSGPRLITQAELLANANDVDGPSLTAVNLVISAGLGSLVDNGDQTWTYTPALNDDSSVSFSYTVTDGSLTVAGSATLDITPINDAPTNSPVTLAPIAEDSGPRIITQAELLANANDVDGPSLTAVNLVISAGLGSLVDNGDQTWTYTPALNDDSSVSFSYTVTDGSLTVAGSATLDITPVNDSPTTSPVTLAPIAEDSGPRIITQAELLANANDVDGPSLTAVGLTISAGTGTLANNGDGTWTYTPVLNDDSSVSFSYTVTDGSFSVPGSATLDITPVNDAPTTTPVTLTPIAEDSGPRLITQAELLANAIDIDGPGLTATGLVISSGLGTLVDNGNGTWTYTPAADDDTAVSFGYTVTDGLLTAAGSATLDITPVNDAPTTTPVTLTPIAEDSGPRLITQAELLANAIDIDGPGLTATGLVISSGLGTLVDNGNGTWTYTPTPNDDTAVNFSYTVTDGLLTAAGSATLDITPVNDAPTTTPVTLVPIAEDSGPRLITQAELLANANDFDGPGLSAINLAISSGLGTLVDNGDGSWTYTPAPNDDSAVGFSYLVTDFSLTAAGSATLDITPVNDAPTNSAVTLAPIAEDSGPRIITQAELLANANDIDGPSMTAVGLAISSGFGSLVDNGDGTWTYTPAVNDDSSVSFSYTVTDGSASVTGSAFLDITPVNDAPTNSPVTLSAIAEDSGPRVITQAELLGNANDVDGPSLTVIGLTISAGFGSLVDNGDQTWTYTPAMDDDLSVSFGYTVTDGSFNVAGSATLDITPVNDAPTTSPVTLTPIAEDSGPRLITQAELLVNANDINGPSLTAINLVVGAGLGSLTDNGDGSWTYTPALNDDSSVSFSYAVTDGSFHVAGSATLDLTPVNDAPTTGPVTLAPIAEDSGPRVITQAELLANAADVDGPALTAVDMVISSGLGSLVDNGDGSWTYTPAVDDDSAVSFGYTVTDGSFSVAGSATLAIAPVNDAPTNSPVTLAPITEDSGPRVITQSELLAHAADVDGPSLTAINLVLSSGLGNLVDNGDQTWTYTPALNDDSSVSFSYTVTDGIASVAGSATLDITPVNDAPVTSPVTLTPIAEDSGPRLITQAELLANAADIDGPALTAIDLVISSGFGSLVDNGDGTWTYTPALNDDSAVSFSYTVTDGSFHVAGSATLDITPVNDAPTTSPVTLLAIAEDSGPRLITQAELLANTTDVDGPALAATDLTISRGAGTLVDNGDGSWTYTPAIDDDTGVTFSYTVTDGSLGAAGIAMLAFTPVNDAPTTSPVTLLAIAEDSGPRLITQAELLSNAADVDDHALAAIDLTISTGLGSLVDNGDGSWTFTPALDDDSSVSFSYLVTDGKLTTPASAVLDITPVDDVPEASIAPVTLQGGGSLQIDPRLLQARDVDNAVGSLAFIVIDVQHGRFEWVDAPGVAIQQFSQTDVIARRIVFVSTSAVDSPSFTIAPFDGNSYGDPIVASIDFRRSLLSTTFSGGEGTGADEQITVALQPIAPPDGRVALFAGSDREAATVRPSDDPAPTAGRDLQALPTAQRILIAEAVQPEATSSNNTRVSGASKDTRLPLRSSRFDNPEFYTRVSADDYVARLDEFQLIDLLQQLGNSSSASEDTFLPGPQATDDQPGSGLMLSDAARASALALTAGTVWWALRAGSLLTGLMVSLPAWRHADLLAVLPDDEDDDDAWGEAEDRESARDENAVDLVFEADDASLR